ncbi:GNAT family N-acetyltransferase [Listeria grandensis]|uniref:GNAT family N-acetyltransferase n=1 Tax=Listeria grandensis TaxID=1494963 RepID=UPI0016238237|nr:GNAT family N-acetyltransferase [Listeria grandensis]MBC1474667.1 GNAT family N-acetyltransferase [Listeria grandensis]
MLVNELRNLPWEFKTNRTLLRVMTHDDADKLLKIWSNTEVTRYMNIETLHTIEQAHEIISAILDTKSANRYVIIDKLNRNIIGSFGINELYLNTMTAEIGYELKQSYWGTGLMAEILNVFIQLIQTTTTIKILTAKVSPENIASSKLLKKLDFTFDKTVSEFAMKTKTLETVEQYKRELV